MKLFKTLLLLACLCLCLAPASGALAGGFYLNPSVGAAIPTEGDNSPSIGLGLDVGYEFTSWLAGGVSYRYLHDTGREELESTHLYDVNATLFKRLVVVTPYVRAGVGAYTMTFEHEDSNTDPLFNIGAGIGLHPIPFIGLTAGVTYHLLADSVDFFEPMITFGFSLGK
ncbi:MAG: outer membrane beta-barrel protein [bacterium]